VSKEEALRYLKLQGINEEQAAQIYELVGGRMMHLKSFADDIKENRTFEGMSTVSYAENMVSFSPPL
jgi:Zn-dependent M28 family amino/carboxypeptidase